MNETVWSNGSTLTGSNQYLKSSNGINDKKRYFEVKILSTSGVANVVIGICGNDYVLTSPPYTDNKVRFYGGTGEKSTPRLPYGSTHDTNDIISVLVDFENNTVEFWKNGISQGVAFSDISALTKPVYAFVSSGNTTTQSYQGIFNTSSFVYEPPKGYLSFDEEEGGVKHLALKNSTTNQIYSLEEKTLIPLPDSSPKNMILHGVEAGKEIRLDKPFNKIAHISSEGTTLGAGKVFEIALKDKPKITNSFIKEVE